jgi:hypothetical protein
VRMTALGCGRRGLAEKGRPGQMIWRPLRPDRPISISPP